MKKRGLFITFEGPEGSGKSTQSKVLCEFLKKAGFSIYHTREPGGTLIGEEIRRILLDTAHSSMSKLTELFLYMACRSQLVEEQIKPALRKGKIVICDRFQDASLAYQGYGLGMDKRIIRFLGSLATDLIKPNLTILLDIKAEEGIKKTKRDDRIERRSLEFHRRVRKGYLEIARREASRVKIIPVLKKVSHTQELVRSVVLNVIKRYKISRNCRKVS